MQVWEDKIRVAEGKLGARGPGSQSMAVDTAEAEELADAVSSYNRAVGWFLDELPSVAAPNDQEASFWHTLWNHVTHWMRHSAVMTCTFHQFLGEPAPEHYDETLAVLRKFLGETHWCRLYADRQVKVSETMPLEIQQVLFTSMSRYIVEAKSAASDGVVAAAHDGAKKFKTIRGKFHKKGADRQ